MQGTAQRVAFHAHARIAVSHRRGMIRGLLRLVAVLLLAVAAPLAAQETERPAPVEQQHGIAYLLRPDTEQLLRYDLAQRQWLTAIALGDTPTAFATSDTHLYVAYGRRIERRSLSGTDAEHVHNTSSDVYRLFVDGNLLIVLHREGSDDRATSISLATLARIDQIERYHGFGPAVIDTASNRIYSVRAQISPSDIDRLAYGDDGRFGRTSESRHHGEHPIGDRLWLAPDGKSIATAFGSIFHAPSLTYARNFDLPFATVLTDMAFVGSNIPVVLNGDRITAYDPTLAETGHRTLARPAQAMLLYGERVFAFQDDPAAARGVTAEVFPLAELAPAVPDQPISPEGTVYAVDDMAVDDNGIAYLLSNTYRSIFRWDIEAQRYLPTLTLSWPAEDIEYAPDLDRLYVLGVSDPDETVPQAIEYLDLASSLPAPLPFAQFEGWVSGLIAVDAELLVDRSPETLMLSSDGTVLGPTGYCCSAAYHFYDAPRRMLYFNDTRMPYLGAGVFVPPDCCTVGFLDPMALSTDARWTVDRRGLIHDAATGAKVDALSNDVLAAAWMAPERLFTVREPQNLGTPYEPDYVPETPVQRWGPRFALEREVVVQGVFVRMAVVGDRVLVVTSLQGRPSFALLDEDFGLVAPATLEAPRLVSDGHAANAAAVRWHDIAGETGYTLERQHADGPWRSIATLAANSVDYLDTSLDETGIYRYRITAHNGALLSPVSNVVTMDATGSDGSGALPGGTDFVADAAALAADGRLYLLSREHAQLFVWSTVHQRWESSIALVGTPLAMSLSDTLQALYMQYDDGGISSLNLRADVPREVAYVDGSAPCGLLAVDDGLLRCAEGSWLENGIVSSDAVGRSRASTRSTGTLRRSAWNPATRMAYHGGESSWSEGRLFGINLLPELDFGMLRVDLSHYPPITGMPRVSPDGATVVLASGLVYNYSSAENQLHWLGQLPNPVTDAAWRNGILHTIHGTALAAHDGLDAARPVATLPHPAQHLFALRGGRLLVAMVEEGARMRFAMYDASDRPVPEAVLSDGFE